MKLSIIILAAGLGKRMYSDLPKVLHPLAEKPLIRHVIDTAHALKPDTIHVVYGHGGQQVRETLADIEVNWVEQPQQLGTGHAVAQVMPNIADDTMVLVLYGDVPLISLATLKILCTSSNANNLGILTVNLDNPYGYGRIVRNAQEQVECIVEEKDADTTIKSIKEVNTGILIAHATHLRQWLASLNNNNAQGEYYLTDIIALAVANNLPIFTHTTNNVYEVMGVNDRSQLATLERYYQIQQVNRLMLTGVTVRDPARIDIRGMVQTGQDVSIDVNVIFEGEIMLGNRVKIGPHTIIRNAKIGDDVEILSHCVIDNVVIGTGCKIGPFARLRPETVLAEQVHIGNFVEIKKSTVAQKTKINHLSYIGDSEVGSDVNIGAGTITCNYDGVHKHKTVIEDRAFIGSDTQLVAPVKVGAGATIGAGSTIVTNTPPDTLTLSRSPQKNIPSWHRPIKKNPNNL
ncbi:bifunctional UDP-N-acetylglucosamine diphosphorylase/glucosamine-1-phosphate N-acetyltransferase GlmU [Candidatus Parabeggiatoa sp. HSG14]|uniref:bifunctional UDP-N-acetylglucosamine diphosphorylase/glucosamine-1-phosphate N-acetyltransferase GlmU n=1 Tax=Candidatus Parabeggiatoa sp. HSG14 TaxID=3055593 RepID=UPI0025A8BDF1|nr:bifunctional UDP-N-acetylglucosamine diphosphorylase/glucosamine-1-phosphate N-acetyltransferase GlmU [Thiotrichales bacterium HSG14]